MNEVGPNASSAEFTLVEFGCGVIADDADVVAAESPTLAGDERSGYLASGHDASAEHLDFGAERREAREAQDGVGGVFADAEDVESRSAHKVVVQGIE